MDAATIQRVARLMGLPYSKPANGWMSVGCPYASTHHKKGRDGNPSMRVEVVKGGLSRWRCFSCGQGGKFAEVLTELRAMGHQYPWGELLALNDRETSDLSIAVVNPEDVEKLPPPVISEDWLDRWKPSWSSPEAIDYLARRNISLSDQHEWEIRYSPQMRRVLFPIRDFAGQLRGVQGRSIDPDTKPKYLHLKYPDRDGVATGHLFWYNEHHVDFARPLVVVEGVIDAIRTSKVWPNVVAVLGASTIIHGKVERLGGALKIVSFLDQDEAGNLGRDVLRQWCYRKRLYSDAVLAPGIDPGAMSDEALWAALANHVV